MHPDVVLRDVLSSFTAGLGDGEVDGGRDAFIKSLREPGFGPTPAIPSRAIFQTLVKSGQRKIQQHDKRQFVIKEIVDDVRGWIIAVENLVEGKYRAKVEIGLLIKLPADLVHVSVKLFEQILEASEHGVERGLITGEIRTDEILKRRRVAIFRAPEFSHLMQSALNERSLRLAILRRQVAFEFGAGVVQPRWFKAGYGL